MELRDDDRDAEAARLRRDMLQLDAKILRLAYGLQTAASSRKLAELQTLHADAKRREALLRSYLTVA